MFNSSLKALTAALLLGGSGLALICHPNPVQGGTMLNKVVSTLQRTARDAGLITLRFNYRGVGASAGTHDMATGEVDDALDKAGVYDRSPEALEPYLNEKLTWRVLKVSWIPYPSSWLECHKHLPYRERHQEDTRCSSLTQQALASSCLELAVVQRLA